MRTLTIAALSTLSLALFATAAHAEETVAPGARNKVITIETTHIHLRVPRPAVAIDINRVTQRSPLSELKKPLVERIAAAVEKDPF